MFCMRCDKPVESGEHKWTLELQDWGVASRSKNDLALSVLSVPLGSSAMRVTLCESCAKRIAAEVKRPNTDYTLRISGGDYVTTVNTADCGCGKTKN